jgi:uncharacterized RDD family membrane protein YckC
MFCPKCGAANDDAFVFCAKCGQHLQNPVAAPPPAVPAPPVPAQVSYAGFWKRLGAYLIDSLIVGIVAGIIGAIIIAATGSDVEEDSGYTAVDGFIQVIAFFGGWIYYALMESSPKKATLGKMALGIVVTDYEGKQISFGKATGRYFGKLISAIILLIGFLMAGWTEKKQALHDMMAGTLVVNEKKG